MPRSLHVRPGLAAALQVVQEGGRPLRRVQVDAPALILVRSGSKQIRAGGAPVVAHTGEMIAVEPGRIIEVTNALPARGPYEATCLALDASLCAAFDVDRVKAKPIALALALGRPPGHLLSAFQRAVDACGAPAETPEAILRHQLHEVLLGLLLLGWRFDLSPLDRTSARVRRLLEADIARRWKAPEVGARLGMSEATLRRRLEREHLTFRGLLSQARMGRALTLLQSTELSVTQIAFEVGYESASQFTHRFRRHFGQSPRRLRDPRARD